MNPRTTRRGHRALLERYQYGESFGTAEQVLLCCFGLNRDANRSAKQLSEALTDAGFSAAAARHVLRESPLLRATVNGHYVLRPFEAAPAA